MSEQIIVLTDVSAGVYVSEMQLRDPSSGGSWSVGKRTLRGGLSDGVDIVSINNGRLSFDVLPTRGMGLLSASIDGWRIGWQSPVTQPVHPRFVDQSAYGNLGWLSGFNELLCRCGLNSNGPPGCDNDGPGIARENTLHGRIANIPAHRVSLELDNSNPQRFSLTGVIDESALFGPNLRLKSQIVTQRNSQSLTITDTVTNLAATPGEFQLLYHTNVGAPLLDAGSQFVAAVRTVVPRDPRAAEGISNWAEYLGPTTGYAEQVYFFELLSKQDGSTITLLHNAAGNRGFSMRFSTTELPCFTLWKNTQATADGYCTGLEPGVNFPNEKPFERTQGRVRRLAPGASYRASLTIAAHTSEVDVSAVRREIAELQQSHSIQVLPQPTRPWCNA